MPDPAIQAAAAYDGGSGPVSVTLATNVTAGNTLVGSAWWGTAGATATMSDNNDGSYGSPIAQTNTGPSNGNIDNVGVFVFTGAAGGSTTGTLTPSSGNCVLTFVELPASSGVRGFNTGTGAAGTSSVSVTGTSTNDVGIAQTGLATTTAVQIGGVSAFIEAALFGDVVCFAGFVPSPGGTVAFTATESQSWDEAAVVMKATSVTTVLQDDGPPVSIRMPTGPRTARLHAVDDVPIAELVDEVRYPVVARAPVSRRPRPVPAGDDVGITTIEEPTPVARVAVRARNALGGGHAGDELPVAPGADDVPGLPGARRPGRVRPSSIVPSDDLVVAASSPLSEDVPIPRRLLRSRPSASSPPVDELPATSGAGLSDDVAPRLPTVRVRLPLRARTAYADAIDTATLVDDVAPRALVVRVRPRATVPNGDSDYVELPTLADDVALRARRPMRTTRIPWPSAFDDSGPLSVGHAIEEETYRAWTPYRPRGRRFPQPDADALYIIPVVTAVSVASNWTVTGALPLTIADLLCWDDVDALARETESDFQTLEQDLYHLLIQDPGTNPDDMTDAPGIGILKLLSGTVANLVSKCRDIEEQFLVDDRVDTCVASVTLEPDGSYLLSIQIGVDGKVVGLKYSLSQAGGLVQISP